MAVTVLYFASLRETLGKSSETVELVDAVTAGDLWQRLVPGVVAPRSLVAINHEYADWSARVHDGDEVAFFPPVTGG